MKIHHAAMFVNDLAATKNFFTKYFGAVAKEVRHNTEMDFYACLLLFDGGTSLQIIDKPRMQNGKKNINHIGGLHISFSLGSKEKVDELTETLKSDGYNVVCEPGTTGDGLYRSCVVAIEGSFIEITI